MADKFEPEDVPVEIISDEEMEQRLAQADAQTAELLPGWEPTPPPKGLDQFSRQIQQATGDMRWMRPSAEDPHDSSEVQANYPDWSERVAHAVEEAQGIPIEERDWSKTLPMKSARTIGNWLNSAHDGGEPTYTGVQQAMDELLTDGMIELAGLDENGEQQYLLTDAGTERAAEVLGMEREVCGTVVTTRTNPEPDGHRRTRMLLDQ